MDRPRHKLVAASRDGSQREFVVVVSRFLLAAEQYCYMCCLGQDVIAAFSLSTVSRGQAPRGMVGACAWNDVRESVHFSTASACTTTLPP